MNAITEITEKLPGLRGTDAEKRLDIYLNDHRAGSVAGLELARRLAGSNEGTEFGPPLAQIADEIEADVGELENVMNRLGVSQDRFKQAGSWLGEKVGRVKLNGQLLGYSPLSRLIELEGLKLGVRGKLALWTALKATLEGDPRVSAVDFDMLRERAKEQAATLEELRLRAAVIAFRD